MAKYTYTLYVYTMYTYVVTSTKHALTQNTNRKATGKEGTFFRSNEENTVYVINVIHALRNFHSILQLPE